MAASELDAGPRVAMIFVFLTMSAFDERQNAPGTSSGYSSGPYRLKEYRQPPASDREFPAATTERPVVIQERHTTNLLMTIDEWLQNALQDADRRNLPALRPLLEGLATSTKTLRAADWNLDLSGELPETPPEHVR